MIERMASGVLVVIVLCFLQCFGTVAAARATDVTPWSTYERALVSSIRPEVIEYLRQEVAKSDEQADALKRLIAGHNEAFEAFAARSRPVKKEWDEHVRVHRWVDQGASRDFAALGRRAEKLLPIAEEQAHLDESFVEAVKALLDDDQIAFWSEHWFEIERRRWPNVLRIVPEGSVDAARIAREILKHELTRPDSMLEGARAPGDALEMTESSTEEWWNSDSVRIARVTRAAAQVQAVRLLLEATQILGRTRDALYARQESNTVGQRGAGGELGRRYESAIKQHKEARDAIRATSRATLETFVLLFPAELQPTLTAAYWQEALVRLGESGSLRADRLTADLLSALDLSDEQRAAFEELRREQRARIVISARRALDHAHEAATTRLTEVRAEQEMRRDAVLEEIRGSTATYLRTQRSYLDADQAAAFDAIASAMEENSSKR